MVASGEVVTPIQAEAAPCYSWPDVIYLPIRGAPLGEWALVWRTVGATPLIEGSSGPPRTRSPSAPRTCRLALRAGADGTGQPGGRATKSGSLDGPGSPNRSGPLDGPGPLDKP